MEAISVISMGWGVQSFTLAVMAMRGELEVHGAIFADTGYERRETLAFAQIWGPRLREAGLTYIHVSPSGNALVDERGFVQIPAYRDGTPLKRQCTMRWKIMPFRRALRGLMRAHRARRAHVLYGISLDEYTRMRVSDVRYIVNVYPLVDRRMTRGDCIAYLRAHNYPIPQRSRCAFCPYQTLSEWRETLANEDDRVIVLEAAQTIASHNMTLSARGDPIRLFVDQDVEQHAFDFDDVDDCGSGVCWT